MWPNPQVTADFTFTKEILNGKLHFLCSEWCSIIDFWHGESLREKCPNTEFFLACVFPHSDWIFPNAGKYGPEKTPYLDNFHAVNMPLFLKQNIIISFNTFQPEDGIFNDKVK